MNSPTTFRTRSVQVEAIRWTGPENCEAVFEFIGWEHPDDELDHSRLFGLGDGDDTAEPGNWIVRVSDGHFRVLADEEFTAKYETVPAPRQPTLGAAAPIERLELPLRAYNCLKREGIDTVGQLTGKTTDDLMDIRAFGIGARDSVVAALAMHGLQLADGAA